MCIRYIFGSSCHYCWTLMNWCAETKIIGQTIILYEFVWYCSPCLKTPIWNVIVKQLHCHLLSHNCLVMYSRVRLFCSKLPECPVLELAYCLFCRGATSIACLRFHENWIYGDDANIRFYITKPVNKPKRYFLCKLEWVMDKKPRMAKLDIHFLIFLSMCSVMFVVKWLYQSNV